ncbi:MAG: phospho-sugar mutase [Clostridiales Family XIII bacterium]|nr:phospho-sugar mutase [Clostridiales Family XIII bacterium]
MNENLTRLEEWRRLPALDDALKSELETLLHSYEAEGPEGSAAAEIDDRFYRDLEFGTAGMRGIMGAGRNRMNTFTVRRASQGFADVLALPALTQTASRGGAPIRIAIAYDNRKDSDLFAFEAACVFVANGIETHLFRRLSATPLLSFAVRKLGASAGIVITASHNGKAYNGYKIYDRTGCQCRSEEANRVAEQIARTNLTSGIKSVAERYTGSLSERIRAAATSEPLLHLIPDTLEDAFVDAVYGFRLSGADGLKNLKVVYTPLNGTGNIPVRQILSKIGVSDVTVVPDQERPDPAFTTCPEPNPEKKEALKRAMDLAEAARSAGAAPDIILGTDPDCDRVGVAVYDGTSYVSLNGNQVGVLLLDYIIRERKKANTLPSNPVMITTIVSTPLAAEIAAKNGVKSVKVLTGFKYIGEKINELERIGEAHRFLLGFEESCGYLSGTHVRDKDAVNAAMLVCEMAADCKQRGITLLNRLQEVSDLYGHYAEDLVEFVRTGEKGMAEIAAAMATARDPKTAENFGVPVTRVTDYARDGDLPPADVVQFDTTGGGRVIFRPSGTEPKLKIYLSGRGDTAEASAHAVQLLREALQTVTF